MVLRLGRALRNSSHPQRHDSGNSDVEDYFTLRQQQSAENETCPICEKLIQSNNINGKSMKTKSCDKSKNICTCYSKSEYISLSPDATYTCEDNCRPVSRSSVSLFDQVTTKTARKIISNNLTQVSSPWIYLNKFVNNEASKYSTVVVICLNNSHFRYFYIQDTHVIDRYILSIKYRPVSTLLESIRNLLYYGNS